MGTTSFDPNIAELSDPNSPPAQPSPMASGPGLNPAALASLKESMDDQRVKNPSPVDMILNSEAPPALKSAVEKAIKANKTDEQIMMVLEREFPELIAPFLRNRK